MYNSPHETESLARVLPGKLLTLDAQCRKDRGTSACFKVCIFARFPSSSSLKQKKSDFLAALGGIQQLRGQNFAIF